MKHLFPLILALGACGAPSPGPSGPAPYTCEAGGAGWTACDRAASFVLACCPGEDWTNLTPEALCGDVRARGEDPVEVCGRVGAVLGACEATVRLVSRGDLPVPGVCR
jgi:hypothetical protein